MQAAPIDESRLRHPRERPIFVASVAANLMMITAAVAAAMTGSDWLASHPRIAEHITRIRVLAIGAVFAFPLLLLLRNSRLGVVAGNSVRLSRDQVPVLYAMLESHCARLGVHPVPELYLSDTATSEVARADSVWRREYIVLGTRLNEIPPEEAPDVFAFTLARELGRLRLGHTRWWDELLLAYVARTPYLKHFLTNVRTYSLDRYGACLVPDGVRGLLVLASGAEILDRVNVGAYLEHLQEYGGKWARLSSQSSEQPHVAYRIKALYAAGLFDLEHDRRRFGAGAAPRHPGAGTDSFTYQTHNGGLP